MFEVYLGREAEKTLKGLSGKLAIRVKEALLFLKTTPIPVRIMTLKRSPEATISTASGYRIIASYTPFIGTGRRSMCSE